MTHQQVTDAPASAQSQNSFAGDCAVPKLLCFTCMRLSPLHWHKWVQQGKVWKRDRTKPCYWHIATHFSWPWCIPG